VSGALSPTVIDVFVKGPPLHVYVYDFVTAADAGVGVAMMKTEQTEMTSALINPNADVVWARRRLTWDISTGPSPFQSVVNSRARLPAVGHG
jgi:hypothetical protein